MRKFVLLFLAVLTAGSLLAQNRQVSGTVSNEEGGPVAGATIIVKDTTIGAVTNSQGHYSIMAPANGVLEISSPGLQTAEVAINNRSVVDVMLTLSSTHLDDVIVIAFGTAKRESFTGSVTVVGSQELSKTQSSNVGDALVGKVAGVQFAAASGRPGAGQSLYVRGVGSISASVGKGPLWVVDGVPFEGDINNINPADMESVTVLKDAASNALYGARGANGVIMVTTKKAKAGEASVTFDAKWGVNTRALRSYDVADGGEFYELHHKALFNYFNLSQKQSADVAYASANNLLLSTSAGGVGYNVYTVPDGQNLIGSNGRLNPNATVGRLVNFKGQDYWLQPDNWLNEIYKSASFRQEYNFSVAGSTDRSNFYASLGYLSNEGIIDGSDNERLTARLRADYQVKKWMKLSVNSSFSHFKWFNGNDPDDEGASDGGNVFQTAIRMAPIYPIYIRDGNGNIMKDQWGFDLYDNGSGRNGGAVRTNGGQSNQLQDIQLNKYINEGNAFSINGQADFDLYEGLKFTVNGSVYVDETRTTRMLNPYYGQFATSGGVIDKGHYRDINYNLQQLLTYDRKIGSHNFNILLGHEYYNIKQYGLSASKSMLWSPNSIELGSAVVGSDYETSSMGEYNNEGYFGRVMYDFDDRYFFSGSYRRDASSRFHPDHRWGNFWSLGATWIMSREEWFHASWVEMLRVKASFGSQGNDNIPNYLYVDYYDIQNDGNGKPTSTFARKGNEKITWETNANLNIGVEFDLWKGRLSGGVDFFNRKTTDMLFSMAVPLEAGYDAIFTNVGDMVNRGVEIDLHALLINTRDFTWRFSVNASYLSNKIIKLPEQYKNNTTADGLTKGRRDGNYFLAEGNGRYAFYIPTFAGVDPETGESLWYKYKVKDGVVDPDKTNPDHLERVTTKLYTEASTDGREYHSDPYPDLFGGFGTSLRYKGIDFSAAFTYQIGGLVLDSGYMFYMGSPLQTSTGNNYHRDLYDSWTPGNTNTSIPRFAYNDANVSATSDRFLTDASFLNIQNISIGYTIPSSFTKKFFAQSLRIYAACDNVWYWSKRQGLDPRQSVSGTTNPFYYAPVRTVSGGINITF